MSTKEARILAFPALRTIPEPELPLKDQAYEKYRELAKRLLDAGKLNSYTRSLCEQIALVHHQNYKRVAAGGLPTGTAVDRMNKLMKELRLVDESDTTAPPVDAQENRFKKFGVVTRNYRGAA